jgi:hypothetical protein
MSDLNAKPVNNKIIRDRLEGSTITAIIAYTNVLIEAAGGGTRRGSIQSITRIEPGY